MSFKKLIDEGKLKVPFVASAITTGFGNVPTAIRLLSDLFDATIPKNRPLSSTTTRTVVFFGDVLVGIYQRDADEEELTLTVLAESEDVFQEVVGSLKRDSGFQTLKDVVGNQNEEDHFALLKCTMTGLFLEVYYLKDPPCK